jgi:hypothetical protein
MKIEIKSISTVFMGGFVLLFVAPHTCGQAAALQGTPSSPDQPAVTPDDLLNTVEADILFYDFRRH